jgi:ATP-dependent Lon protease
MESFEKVAQDNYGSLIINKALARKAGFGSRAIPVYVREWIVAYYVGEEDDISDKTRMKIADFVRSYVPDKGEREVIKNQLYEQFEVKLLDDYSVQVDLAGGDRYLVIPYLDETKGSIPPYIVRDNEMLLSSGIWGVGTLAYAPPMNNGPGQVILRKFTPFQLANFDLDYFISRRREFTTEEWIDFIVNSMGFNHKVYTKRQKLLLISRLIPMVEPRYNLIELAPKGTGKSFVFENMSRYVAVRTGNITAPVLFYNDHYKAPGLITKYDCVVIDEAQKVRADHSGELTALLKSYLESGRFGRGSASSITAESGIVILANIYLDEHKRPLHELIGLFRDFPNFLQETAFLDRFSGLLPGWDLPRVTKETPSKGFGLKGDIFGEILHLLRYDIRYQDFVKTRMELENCDDMRDNRSIEAGASGLLKILFPDMNPTEEEFYQYCVNLALEMRQRVRDELCKLDREYVPLSMRSKYMDDFQIHHKKVSYIDLDEIDLSKLPKKMVFAEEPDEHILVSEVDHIFEKEAELTDSELDEKTLLIKDGETGYSYQNLFSPYFKDASKIYINDPYIRLEFQLRNLIALIGVLEENNGPKEIHLTTSSDDDYQMRVNSKKFDELATSLAENGINFSYKFSDTIHRRGIHLDNGWRIIIDRGLDIFQKPESKYGLEDLDQSKRRCRETEIIYMHDDSNN